VTSDDPHLPQAAAIEAYGKGGFRFAEMSHRGSILCLPSGIYGWEATVEQPFTGERLLKVFEEAESYKGTSLIIAFAHCIAHGYDLKAGLARYLYRVTGNWFIGAQGNAANYQVLGDSAQDDLVLETLGVRALTSAAIGGVGMYDSRDNPDMPKGGWYLNVNNLAYREALGGSATYDAYRVDWRGFWSHGRGHVLGFRQYNWFTHDAPAAALATVVLRGYKFGEYLAPYMSSFEAEERLSFSARWGATLFAGVAGLYGERGAVSANRDFYPTGGAGIHFVIKPAQRMLVNFEYAQGVEGNHGVYLKFGYAW